MNDLDAVPSHAQRDDPRATVDQRLQLARPWQRLDEYQSAEVLTLGGNSQIGGSMIQHGNWRELPWASRLWFERILQG